MNEVFSLLVILFVVYLLQCISGSPQGTIVFRVDSRLRGRIVHNFFQVGRSQFRLFLINPLFPLSSAVYADPLPFSFLLGPAGTIVGVDFTACSSNSSDVGAVTFEVHHDFVSNAKKLLIDDSPVARFHSERAAVEMAGFLNQLQSSQPLKRAAMVERDLRRRFAFDTIKERLEFFARCTGFLGSISISLYLLLFVIAPASIYLRGLESVWPILVLFLVSHLILILWAFRRAQQRLFPRKEERDLQALLSVALSPFAAIRAIDPLAAGLFATFHPIAVARALLPLEDFLHFAGKELRRIKFTAHDTILEDAIRNFLLMQNVDPQSLLKPPAPTDVHSRTYCPICLTQYVLEEGTCNDCDGVPLKLLA